MLKIISNRLAEGQYNIDEEALNASLFTTGTAT